MLDYLLPAATIFIQGRSLWVRRATWRCRWERAMTLAILLQCIAFLVWSPAVSDALLFKETGIYNLDDLLAHVLLLCSLGALAIAVLSRLDNDEVTRRRLWHLVYLPIGFGLPIMIVCIALSTAVRHHRDTYLLTVKPGLWEAVYIGTYGILVAFMAFEIMLNLLPLCADTRKPNIAPFVVGGISCHAMASALMVAALITDDAVPVQMVNILLCANAVTLALAAQKSWRYKTRPLVLPELTA